MVFSMEYRQLVSSANKDVLLTDEKLGKPFTNKMERCGAKREPGGSLHITVS